MIRQEPLRVILPIPALALLVGCPPPPPAPQTVAYVNAAAPPGGNGASWDSAFNDLQDAFSLFVSSDAISEIWVAAGTYHPDGPNGDRAMSFFLFNGLAVYGGFAGDETERHQRDPVANVTILSGDLNDDDDGFLNTSDNTYHVVSASQNDETAVLDGFTITGGNAQAENNPSGGGIITADGNPTIANCIIQANQATQSGAGCLNLSSNPTFTNCTFRNNQALVNGGAMINLTASPALSNCSFDNNSATEGGAVFNRDASTPALADCTFRQNSALNSGGAVFNFTSRPTLTRCVFSANSALSGGALVNNSGSDALLTNCMFLGNAGANAGGAIENFASSPMLTNCLLAGNTSTAGGAVINASASNPVLINCTLARNSAPAGGGIRNSGGSSPTLTNSILWANSSLNATGEIAQISTESGTPNINYSVVQGGWSGAGGTGIITDNPLFSDEDGLDDVPGTEDDDLRLAVGSPAIDAGDNTAVGPDLTDLDGDGDVSEPIPLDLDGKPRFRDDLSAPDAGNPGDAGLPVVDIGAYEH